MTLKKNMEVSFGFTLMQEHVMLKKITSSLLSHLLFIASTVYMAETCWCVFCLTYFLAQISIFCCADNARLYHRVMVSWGRSRVILLKSVLIFFEMCIYFVLVLASSKIVWPKEIPVICLVWLSIEHRCGLTSHSHQILFFSYQFSSW